MAEHSTIEWTEATRIVDRGGRRVRLYQRKDPSRPGAQERKAKAALGFRWCRSCRDWLPTADVTKNGLCRPHEAEDHRQRYATNPAFRAKRIDRAMRQHRGVAAVPLDAAEMLMELFEGRCAYCPSPATTFDHFDPVSKGGQTAPGNMLPACRSCNSKKKDRDPDAWLDRAPDLSPFAVDLLSLAGRL